MYQALGLPKDSIVWRGVKHLKGIVTQCDRAL